MRDPCPQTFISGPVVSVQALSEFNMIRAHDDQVAPHLHVPDQDASRGNEADHEALPHDVAFHLIGRSAATDGADGGAGDPGRPLHRQHAEPGRFRCVPKDTAGEWRLIDSVPKASQRKMTPRPTFANACRGRRTGSSR
jgi:hypothetical protein